MTRTHLTTLAVATLVVLSTLGATGAAVAADGDTITYGPSSTPSWIVTVENGSLDTLDSWAASGDDRAVLATHNASNTAVVRAPSAAAGQGLLQRVLNDGLAHNGYVVDVTPNIQHSLAEPVGLENQSAVSNPGWRARALAGLGGLGSADWSPAGIAYAEDADRALPRDVRDLLGVDEVSATGDGATVAVIDSGVNAGNGRVFGNGTAGSATRILDASKDFVENETVAADGLDAVADPNGHGTWVASSIAANHSNDAFDGIAPDADVLALRALDDEGSGSTADIASAVRYAADHDADSIVMSLGSPVYDDALTDALEYATDEGVTGIAIAAGNSRQTTRWLASPADAPVDGVAAVTATNTSANASSAGVAYFANIGNDPGVSDGSLGTTRGETVDVGAPGMNLVAKTPTTSGTVVNSTKSGTSMAGPQVGSFPLLGVESGAEWVGDAPAFTEALRDTARPVPNAPATEIGAGMAAADKLLAGNTTGSQADAMTDTAAGRDAFWEGLSGSQRYDPSDWISSRLQGLAN